MSARTFRLLILGLLCAAFSTHTPLAADPPDGKNLPTPADVKELQVQPASAKLTGPEDSRQLVLTGILDTGRLQDITSLVKYEVADAKIVRVTASGLIFPLASGSTTITVRFGARSVIIPVIATSVEENLPINFANHVVPIFTKLGCNGGGCHGKSGGQNGFALSLLGFVPELDYQTLVKENRGRRLFPASPDNSLLLLKATGAVAHGGGKRMEAGSVEYKIIRRWIAAGTPVGNPADPVVVKIAVYPERRILTRNNFQQLSVLATCSDGSVLDVTQRAQFDSNDTDLAVVDSSGLVRTLDLAGEATIMARYLGQVATFRATVPLGIKIPDYQFEAKTLVDRFTHKKWQELGITPSQNCSDEHFIRRVSLDISGTLPSAAQVKEFLADPDPARRDKLIDALLETPEYSYYLANRWSSLLRVRRGKEANRAQGNILFHKWIKDSIADDKPYDQFAREILLAIGEETKNPPVVWYRDMPKPENIVNDACQLFLGMSIACAQCHHHPYEKWSQDDYWGMAAFFGQLSRQGQGKITLSLKATGTVINTRTSKPARMMPLDGDPIGILPKGEDPRARLADWMTGARNPFFARAIANRYWAHFFGKGLVDPLDDMRVTNPPSNPELLDALAQELVDNKFSLKHLIRVICKSRTYQLSAMPNEFNKHDKRSFARFYPRRMIAEVVFDAVTGLTDSPPNFPGGGGGKNMPAKRAIMLPDEAFQSYFLDVFDRVQRLSACECERVRDANLAQALHLINSPEVQNMLSRTGGRADQMAKDPRPDADKVEELFLRAFARRPSQVQLDLALQTIAASPNRKVGYETILWALINAKEFILIQ